MNAEALVKDTIEERVAFLEQWARRHELERNFPAQLTVDDVAAAMRVSARAVRGWIDAGALGHMHIGNTITVSPHCLEDFRRRYTVLPGAEKGSLP